MNPIFKLTILMVLVWLVSFNALGASLASGESHTLALKDDGSAWGWGANILGELGDGTTDDRKTPVQVIGLSDVISISVGKEHSLAVKRDGTAWAWGWNGYGQLGNGTTTSYMTPNPTPGQVLGISGVIDVSGGSIHSLLLKSDGTVWACGSNRKGQIGDGTTTDRSTPVQVTGLSGVISIAAAASGEHSLALKSDGTVWAWGNNIAGQLGDGNGGPPSDPLVNTNYSTVPVQAIGLSNVIAIAAGIFHSLAIKHDGTMWGWGGNGYGELGDGHSGTNNLIPVQGLVPGVISIAAGGGGGSWYSLALTSYGAVWFFGSLLIWNSGPILSEVPVQVDGISGATAITAGEYRAFVLKNDGTIWGWGDNTSGVLGDGTSTDRRSPVQVRGFSIGGSASVPAAVLAADFDEDGKADPTAISSSGELFYWNSSQSFSRHGPQTLGSSGTPAVGDVNADGKPDLALVDSAGLWYFFLSGPNDDYSPAGSQAFGVSGTPLLADFDGDGKADPTIVSAAGVWHVWLSGAGYSPTSGQFLPSTVYSLQPVSADFDADGRADPVMVTSSGDWYLWPSSELYTQHGPYNFGVSGKPVAGDFDGDRKADPGMVDSTGNWNLFLSDSFYTRNGPWYLVLP